MTIVETWENKMKREGKQFAQIQTNRAIYDRCAIIKELPTVFIIQFPKNKSKSKNLKPATSSDFTIVQDSVAKRDLTKPVRYYKN
jgi:hypothetical protein